MKTIENRIKKMNLAIEAMEEAKIAANEARDNLSHETETHNIDGREIQIITDEASASIDRYLQASKNARAAEKAAAKAVANVAEAFGFTLKKKLAWPEDIKYLALRLVARYEETLAVMHKLSQYDEYLQSTID